MTNIVDPDQTALQEQSDLFDQAYMFIYLWLNTVRFNFQKREKEKERKEGKEGE